MKAIITADWHLRSTIPRCRKDEDWVTTQYNLIKYVVDTANKKNCDIIINGDIFDSPTVPNIIVNMFIDLMKGLTNKCYFIPGNHDLPQNCIDNINKSSIGILSNISNISDKIIYGVESFASWIPFGKKDYIGDNRDILCIHRLVFPSLKDVPPSVEAICASDLLKEYPDTTWIFTGDMHKSFHYEKNGKHVVNPGSLYRGTVDQKDYQPIMYYVDTDKDFVTEIKIPDNEELVDDSYIIEEKEKIDRIGAFVEGVKKNGKLSLDFILNVDNALKKNRNLKGKTVDKIKELMEVK